MAKAPNFHNIPHGVPNNSIGVSNNSSREDGAIRLALDNFVQQCLLMRGLSGSNKPEETHAFLSKLSLRMEEKSRQLQRQLLGGGDGIIDRGLLPIRSPPTTEEGRIIAASQPSNRRIFPPIPIPPQVPVAHVN